MKSPMGYRFKKGRKNCAESIERGFTVNVELGSITWIRYDDGTHKASLATALLVPPGGLGILLDMDNPLSTFSAAVDDAVKHRIFEDVVQALWFLEYSVEVSFEMGH